MITATETVKRRAPKKGYTSEVKEKYREDIWSYLAPKILKKLTEDNSLKVLLLPSKEGFEIDTAIRYGIKENQIIAVDENPAVIAHSRWRRKYPNVNFFASKISKVGEKIAKKNWTLIAANLDFCNTFSQELIDEINDFLNNAPLVPEFTFCITMGKGRESKALLSLLKHIKAPEIFKNERLATLYHMIDVKDKFRLSLDFEKEYFSTFPMIYACFSFKYFKFHYLKNDIERLHTLYHRNCKVYRIKPSKNNAFKLQLKEFQKILLEFDESSDMYDIYQRKITLLKKYIRLNQNYHTFRIRKANVLTDIITEIRFLQKKIVNELKTFIQFNNIILEEQYIDEYMEYFNCDNTHAWIINQKQIKNAI